MSDPTQGQDVNPDAPTDETQPQGPSESPTNPEPTQPGTSEAGRASTQDDEEGDDGSESGS